MGLGFRVLDLGFRVSDFLKLTVSPDWGLVWNKGNPCMTPHNVFSYSLPSPSESQLAFEPLKNTGIALDLGVRLRDKLLPCNAQK